MKRVTLLFFAMVFTHSFSQDKIQQVEVVKTDKQISELFDEIGDTEIKLDVIDILTQPALNLGYEKISDPYSSYGAEIFFNFNNDNSSSSFSEKFSLNPYYRFYFVNKTDFGGEGYFAEVFIKFSNVHYDIDTYNYVRVEGDEDGDGINDYNYFELDSSFYNEKKSWDIAPGIGVGRKWVNKKGWTFEYMVGFGRYLFADDESDAPNYYDNSEVDEFTTTSESRPVATFKGGISIGKRF